MPGKGDSDNPHYIGGTFAEPGTANPDQCEPLYGAYVEVTEALPNKFQDGAEDIPGELLESEEYHELKAAVGQKARRVIDEANDWARSAYPAYANRMINSVRSKQEEYDLDDDLANEFESMVRKNVNALLDNVNDFFDADTLLDEDEANSAFYLW